MKILLTLFVLLFSSLVVAEDISDFEIEGMSLGDSLLNYLSKEEIIEEIKRTRYMYEYLTDEFGEVYLYKNFETYDFVSFAVKPKDKDYIIFAIRGILEFEKLDDCLKKQNEIVKFFEQMFIDIEIESINFDHPVDPTGRSKRYRKHINLDSGDRIEATCDKFEKNLKIKNNWIDGLDVMLSKKEIIDWLRNH